MRTILISNSKGGSGKSTLCTNLACYLAKHEDAKVVIEDLDPQGSAIDWLHVRAARDDNLPTIQGVKAWKESPKTSRGIDYTLIDSPAALRGKSLEKIVRRVDTILIPVLPSPMDIRAAAKFIQEILLVGKVNKNQVNIGIVANRVREYTLMYQQLERFLKRLEFSFIAKLRDTQNYARSADQGIGVHEMPESIVQDDLDQWEPLIKWVKNARRKA